MMHINFALAIYPQRRGERNSPYILSPALREEAWGVLKVLLATTYAHLEQDLHTLAFPADLHITTYDDSMVRLYECRGLKWASHYPEVHRVLDTTDSIGKNLPHMCVELLGVNHGNTAFFNQLGYHSSLLKAATVIQVNI
jgi:hypothetical protein